MRVKPQAGPSALRNSINPLLATIILAISAINAIGCAVLQYSAFSVEIASEATDKYQKIAAVSMTENADKYDAAALVAFITTGSETESRIRKKLLAVNTSPSAEVAIAEFMNSRLSLAKTGDIKTEITAVNYKKNSRNILVEATSRVSVNTSTSTPKPVRELFVVRMSNDRGIKTIDRFGHCTGDPDLSEKFDEFKDATKPMCTKEEK